MKSKINTQEFSKMNCPESVYLMGFIFADGHCRKKSPQISIHMSTEDLNELLFIINKFGDWKTSSYISNGGKSTYIQTTDKEFYDFFVNLDYKNKSYIEPTKILSIIPNDLKCYFWRGFFDGDATWTFKKGNYKRFSIAGRFDYQWEEVIKLFHSLGIKKHGMIRRERECGKSSEIALSSFESIETLGNYIYKNYENENIGLSRKYKKFKEISTERNEIEKRKKIFVKNLQTQEIFIFDSFSKVKKFLKCKYQNLIKAFKEKSAIKGFLVQRDEFSSNGDSLHTP